MYLEACNSSPIEGLVPHHDCFYVYNQAVFFNPFTDTSPVGVAFYTAVLQFNIALARHIRAQNESTFVYSTGGKGAPSLRLARKYYKMCLKTLREAGVDGDRPPYPGGGESMIYLMLAALNNLAHIQTLCQDFDKVHDTLTRLFKLSVAQRTTLLLDSADHHHPIIMDSPPHSAGMPLETSQDFRAVQNVHDGPRAVPLSEDGMDQDCSSDSSSSSSSSSGNVNTTTQPAVMTTAFVSEVLLNVMVAGPIAGASAA